ncbi:putative inorganic carbon transporter subunit DabA [Massilia sp. W12]|uniref:putative inorganic carbon transporter subunit DabA n=1 Tax=Massilia sp. W12 TaxID=3126507 RepID=UPI0030D5A10F
MMNAALSAELRHLLAQEDALEQALQQACDRLAPHWPLATFTARSPWLGLEDLDFHQVAQRSWHSLGAPLYADARAERAAWQAQPGDPGLLRDTLRAWLMHWKNSSHPAEHSTLLSADLLNYVQQRLLRQAGATDGFDLLQAASAPLEAAPRSLLAWQTRSRRALAFGTAQQQAQARLLDALCARSAKYWLGRPLALWPAAGGSFWTFARQLCATAGELNKAQNSRLQALPSDPRACIAALLPGLCEAADQADYLSAHLFALHGWAGMLQQQAGPADCPILYEWLALRLALESILLPLDCNAPQADKSVLLRRWLRYSHSNVAQWNCLPPPARALRLALARDFDPCAEGEIWLRMREELWRRQLRVSLRPASCAQPQARPMVQLVFCIDVRSEALRRALELAASARGMPAGALQTLSCAGFFGLAAHTHGLDQSAGHASCPAILQPSFSVREQASAAALLRYRQRRAAQQAAQTFASRAKQDNQAALVLPELAGPWHGLRMLWRNLAPVSWRRTLDLNLERWRQKPQTRFDLRYRRPLHAKLAQGLSLEQQVQACANALRSINLHDNFAPLLIIAGHGSQSENNPYAAKLQCGACGGAAGGMNARLLAQMLNDAQVRAGLAQAGIQIPQDCHVMAAQHQTSLDQLDFLSAAPDHGAAAQAWNSLQSALPLALHTLALERLALLPGEEAAHSPAQARLAAWRRSHDAAELRPEWGLVNNAALILAPRAISRHANLGGRAFLHEYEAANDADGSLLASLCAGPATVAQWINLQYLASSNAPHYHGSGDKASQSICSGLGVVQGNGSDLLPGLPWQAVMRDDAQTMHQAQRLQLVIAAPDSHILRLLQHNPALARKVRHGWLLLASIAPQDGGWRDWLPGPDGAIISQHKKN